MLDINFRVQAAECISEDKRLRFDSYCERYPEYEPQTVSSIDDSPAVYATDLSRIGLAGLSCYEQGVILVDRDLADRRLAYVLHHENHHLRHPGQSEFEVTWRAASSEPVGFVFLVVDSAADAAGHSGFGKCGLARMWYRFAGYILPERPLSWVTVLSIRISEAVEDL